MRRLNGRPRPHGAPAGAAADPTAAGPQL